MYTQPLKIIWNITNKCGYNCEICATHSDRDELDIDNKFKILESLVSIGCENIREIDFAGGDPLFESNSIKVIYNAINLLGKEKVSVTTTGRGINSALASGEDLSKLLYNCEITIDHTNGFGDYIRKDFSYINTNKNIIKIVEKSITNLTVNIPILNQKVDVETIYSLVNDISQINVNNISVNLIRLMNVGKMNSFSYSNSQDYEKFIRMFIECSNKTNLKDVHLHCALRGKFQGAKCNMLYDKIGVDCSGNIFACAWGGYIKGYNKNNIYQNPFYLGNLLEKSLLEILEDKYYIKLEQLIKKHPTNQCRVYCYKNNDSNSIFIDNDPLFK